MTETLVPPQTPPKALSKTPEKPATDEPTWRSLIGKIAFLIHPGQNALSSADMAQLRRLSAQKPYSSALWKILLHCDVPEKWAGGANQAKKEKQWATLLAAMAQNPTSHDPKTSFGKALADAGWSELRLVRLLESRDEQLDAIFRQMAAYLSSKGKTLDWSQAGQLIFWQDGEVAENIRQDIARDYYRAVYAASK